MNQAILFNDDLFFNEEQDAWCFSALLSGQSILIYIHSKQLNQLADLDSCTKFDLEEVVELWLEKNEPEGTVIDIQIP